MYRVAICEDEKVYRSEQEGVCRNVFEKLNIEYHISAFEASADFWDAFHRGARFDLTLLDIIMDETNGVELARKIREHDNETTIIFITSSQEFAMQGYDVNALHYLMKPLEADVLERLIASDYQKRFQTQTLIVKSGTQTLRIPIKEIISLETVGRQVEITLSDGIVGCSGKLSELTEGREPLIRCHKGYAVNIANVRGLTRTDAIAVNGNKIPVGRTYAKDVQKAFLRQMRDG
jgi:DNA-binding LytR/AlgR family response regulator